MALNCKRKIKEIMVIFCFLSLPCCLNLDSIWFAKKLYITIQIRGIVGNFFPKKVNYEKLFGNCRDSHYKER